MIQIDFERGLVLVQEGKYEATHPIGSPEAFEAVSKAWLRCGWDNKYVYTFTWLGRPIIQLPDDLVRMQEVIYQVKPDVILETGVAHGGSLIYYASLCSLMGKGRVIGIDIEIRPHNRKAIENHELARYIQLIEGNSVSEEVARTVKSSLKKEEKVFVVLDSKHSKEHVLRELEIYSPLVSPGSYIVACDGIMKDLAGAPRSEPDWVSNNPWTAIQEFLKTHPDFVSEQPAWLFNEGTVKKNVTYWPQAYLKKLIDE